MTEDFEYFLHEASTAKMADEYGDLLARVFCPLDDPATEAEIENAERRIETSLPASFKLFLRVLGPGNWASAGCISSVDEIDVFIDCWEVSGFVGIVDNVREVGDHLAFNPRDPEIEGERPVYYFGHDPFGYARVADSFESWARETVEAAKREEDYYEKFDDAVWAKWQEFKATQPKKWWQFWL